jgi:hypothetical protein
MSNEVKKEMNNIIKKFKYVMFEFANGQVKWLKDHHKFLDPEEAPKIIIGPCSSIPNSIPNVRFSNRNKFSRIVYLTSPI